MDNALQLKMCTFLIVKIQPNWINDVYEYGLCTRITSRDTAISVSGICPEPLRCEERKDKHVCSCGKDKFRDLDDPNQCGKNKFLSYG